MKTTIPKPSDIIRKWYLVDASGAVPGRIAPGIADLLRGKTKPLFSPHLDCGDYVVVINAAEMKFSGNKLDGKTYYRHSGYPGALKGTPLRKMMERNPEQVLEKIVSGMLPKNRLRKEFLSKLKIFADQEHPHVGQKPEPIVL